MKRILYVRQDKIGDFTLTWPAFYLLKTAMPEAKIDVFVSSVVKSFALACPYLDGAIVDTGDDEKILEQLIHNQYDAVIVPRLNLRLYRLFKKANIPFKMTSNEGYFQYLYSNRTSTKYKKGEPCWRGGFMLASGFLKLQNKQVPTLPKQLWDVNLEREQWRKYYQQQSDECLIFVHPGTGGSSGGLPIDKMAGLIRTIDSQTNVKCHFVLTYSAEEKALAQSILDILANTSIKVHLATPLKNLAEFARSIVAADLFIAGSTGPIHIAGLHNVPTVGFYAGRKSEPKVRWQTLTEPNKRLAFTPPVGRKTGRNMALVDVDQAGKEIAAFLTKLYS